MCPPDYFSIQYEINPWMDVTNQVDPSKAQAQWQQLYDYYVDHGVQVELIEPSPEQPDMVFTANAGIVYKNTFVSGKFRFQERKGEEQHFQKWFKEHGFSVKTLEHFQGGEGDALFFRDVLYMGYGFRSELEAHDEIAHILGVTKVSLKLVDPYFYDFDTAFCPIGNKAVLYYPLALDEHSQSIMEKLPEAIAITKTQAEHFVNNSVYCNGTLLVGYIDDELEQTLQSIEIPYHYIDMSEFKKSGGGIKCCTLYIE